MTIDTQVLKHRVKNAVTFAYFQDDTLYYHCADGFEFPVPVEDTKNGQGGSAKFKATDRGMLFMKWIRKAMVAEAEAEANATSFYGHP